MEHWLQNYDPLRNAFLSTTVAALPVVVLLSAIAIFRIRIHLSALIGLAVALTVALFAYGMPLKAAAATTLFGAAYGLFPIGWIILNLIFLYQLTVKKGLFEVLRNSLGSFAPDPRVQVILIAFSFGAFFEGAAGFGTPVAVTAAILIQLGFKPLQASGLSLIANTAPVAYGALGTPIIALSGVTGLDLKELSAMVGRQLPFFSLIIPFWVVWAYAGFHGMLGVWPAALTAGTAFAVPQFLVSKYHGPWLVDIVASISSMAAIAVLLKFWKPNGNREGQDTVEIRDGDTPSLPETRSAAVASDRDSVHARGQVFRAWVPWVLLSLLVFLWGVPQVKKILNEISATKLQVAGLHNVVIRTPPVVAPPTPEKPTKPEEAVFALNWLSATGTGILVSAIIAGFIMGFGAKEIARTYWETLVRVRFSLITIAAMLALGYVTRYSGSDATLGLALAKTGKLYPFFGTLLGWLGVALTGSDTASNVLFGSLQTITAKQTGLSPVLMAAANSSGGVMGKMVDAQSIVVASTATNWYGHEDKILRYVFFHSLALAALVGILVYLQAYVTPFTHMVVK
ncbi:MAG: lactate permease [Verrucomicrobia bacterium]|nr:MAG: lactate permease [Verrucomicrobiota bacterium]PYK01049.1 MAG: lactate permease [Verrucomicrobiota bacterium]